MIIFQTNPFFTLTPSQKMDVLLHCCITNIEFLFEARIAFMSTMLIFQEYVSLADKTWFKTGGKARFFVEPRTAEEFRDALLFAREKKLPIFVLGSGANVLVSDSGFPGLVIRPQLQSISIVSEEVATAIVTAGAGVIIDDLIAFCLDHQLIGLEELSGIPGTVGGSVFINIHYFNHLLSNYLIGARVIDAETGAIEEVDASWFHFGYDYSTLHKKTHYLVDATFKVAKVSPIETSYARGRSVEIVRHRKQRFPYQGTCGSFFRNFHENEVTIESNGKKMIYIAYYLDKLGLKGELSSGGAIVSYQHANMIVNRGNATSADIINLARMMQEKVRDSFGIIPQPECQFVGFDKNPLL